MIKQQQSLPVGSYLTVKLECSVRFHSIDSEINGSTVLVEHYDRVSSIFDLIGLNNSQVKLFYKGEILCPALSFAFYKIQNNDTISIVDLQISNNLLKSNKNSEKTDPINFIKMLSSNVNNNRSFTLSKSSLELGIIVDNSSLIEKYSKQKECFNQIMDQKFKNIENNQGYQDSINRISANESARLVDIYRSRIESNIKSFRKLCTKYREIMDSDPSILSKSSTSLLDSFSSQSNFKDKNLNSGPSKESTVLPRKPSYPSTDLLPTLSSFNHI